MTGWSTGLLIGICACAVFIALQTLGVLQNKELSAFDKFLLWRQQNSIDERIVLITETETDLQRFGHPLSDQVLADALQRLVDAGAKVIGVDKYRDIPIEPGTETLDNVLRHYDNIVWIFFIGNARNEFVRAPPVIADDIGRIGFNDVIEDPDGITRRGLLFLGVDETHYYAFPLLVALHYLFFENIVAQADANGALSLNGVSLPPIDSDFAAYRRIDARGYQIILDYPGLSRHFTNFSLNQLIDGKIPDQALKDKIVLLGSAAPSLPDYRLLPKQIRRFGVEYHAYFVSQLLNTAIQQTPPLRSWPNSGEYVWLLLWCLVGALTGLFRGCLKCLFALIAAEALLLCLFNVLLLKLGWWVPFIAPLSGWASALSLSVLYFYNKTRVERRQLMRLFASHVSPEVAAKLWASRTQFFNDGKVQPDELTATVLFTDLTNFTTVAETMDPVALMNWLNEYMAEMSAIVMQHGGIVNKYIGDAIMAVFGVPIKHETENEIANDAKQAVECALAFNRRLLELNQRWSPRGLPNITMRVGIYTGKLVAGSFGGNLRMEYTVLGDTVNIASRLESFDKTIAPPCHEQPCRILIGDTTYRHVGHLFDATIVGESQLKGKSRHITIYRIIPLSNENVSSSKSPY